MQHVATWKEGDTKWAYHDDAFANIATHKVSLDPYRLQSRRILALMKEILPPVPIQKIEKASIDEVFLDLSAQVHQIMLERYPELQGPPPYDDPTERLPAPPTTALDWNADALIDLDNHQTEEDAPDWDDIAMLIGSEIVRKVRTAVHDRLKYTCSAGIACNKMLAKLGAGHKKPNNQTVIRNRAIQQFLSTFKFTKIRNLGGKLGDEVVEKFNTDTVQELLSVPIEQLKKQIGDDTGTWLYQTIRGEDHSEVNPRTQIKSMLSAKSFRPSINNFDVAVKWLRIFTADIHSRCVEEGVCKNKRRPKTINLHHRQGAQTRSRQIAIPIGRPFTEEMLFDLAKNLLAQVVAEYRAWPCAMLSLSVGGFEDGITGNKGIGAFLVRGEDAKALQAAANSTFIPSEEPATTAARPAKRRKVEEPRINNFFLRQEESTGDALSEAELQDLDDLPSAQRESQMPVKQHEQPFEAVQQPIAIPLQRPGSPIAPPKPKDPDNSFTFPSSCISEPDLPPSSPAAFQQDERAELSPSRSALVEQPSTFTCPRCNKTLLADQQEEHDDWHFAQELQAQDEAERRQQTQQLQTRAAATPVPQKPRPPASGRGGKAAGRGRGRPPGTGGMSGGGIEKGQKKLAFG